MNAPVPYRLMWAGMLLAGILSGCATLGSRSGSHTLAIMDESIELDDEFLPRRSMNAVEEAQWLLLLDGYHKRIEQMLTLEVKDNEGLRAMRRKVVELMLQASQVYSYLPPPVEEQVNVVINRIDATMLAMRKVNPRRIDEVRIPVYRLPRSYTFAWPLDEFSVSCEFGWRVHPILNRRHFHDGIDLVAGRDTTVFAAAPGRVAFSGYKRRAGNVVVIDHPGGYRTFYAHLSELLVAPGMIVSPGNPIGTVGNTGLTTGPHVHFKVTRGDLAVDPRDVIGLTVESAASPPES